jgi:autotransporter strand-loop-strand O-heptosyltransferase
MNLKNKNILIYCDKQNESLSLNLIESFDRLSDKYMIYFYTIGFDSEVKKDNVIKQRFDEIPRLPHIQLYKPLLIQDLLTKAEAFVYVDSDAIVSKHFNYEQLLNSVKDYPKGSYIPGWDEPCYWYTDNGVRYELGYQILMQYLGVPKKTQQWASSCMLAVNKSCKDFVDEWVTVCMKKDLWGADWRKYFVVGEEAPYNILLWKHGVSNYYYEGTILEPKTKEVLCEMENIGKPPQSIYHQLKDLDFRRDVLKILTAKKVKFGIYTSFYNAEKYIDRIFDNISKIKYDNYEWVITDDFSSDRTRELLLEKVKTFNKVRYVEQSRKKEMYWQPNKFFTNDVEYIVLVDIDDLVDANCLNVYNEYLSKDESIYLVSSDFKKISENTGELHSIALVNSQGTLTNRIQNYHPITNYTDTLNYYCFGHLRCFKNTPEIKFEIPDFDACAEDSYHVMYVNSYGKWLHVPRNLYQWSLNNTSESQLAMKPNFNANFDIAYEKCKKSNIENDGRFTSVYKETCALNYLDINNSYNTINIFTGNTSEYDRSKIRELYFDKTITFNEYIKCDLHVVILNSFLDVELTKIFNKLSAIRGKFEILTYYQNDSSYSSVKEKNKDVEQRVEYYLNSIRNKTDIQSWFSYNRHLYIKANKKKLVSNKKTILMVTPHLSTGGLPAVICNRIELLNSSYNIICVEWECVAPIYIVQRNKIKEMLGERFISLDKKEELLDIINEYTPEIIYMEEFPEFFIPSHISENIYRKNRSYKIIETTHNPAAAVEVKKLLPDKFIFVSDFTAKKFETLKVPSEVIEYPVDIKIKKQLENQTLLGLDPTWKHVLNVGLFTRNKNQGYIFNIAKQLKNYKIKFHFVGNTASNFQDYWEPLLKEKPDNCILWGERGDVGTFMQACDVFLFPSLLELNPIVVKEAFSNQLPIMMYTLESYKDKYDNRRYIELTGNAETDSTLLLQLIKPGKVVEPYYPKNRNSVETVNAYINAFSALDINMQVNNAQPVVNSVPIKINHHFVRNPFLEIIGTDEDSAEYKVQFLDEADNVVHEDTIKPNMWVKTYRQFYTRWRIKVWNKDKLIYDYTLNLKDQRVYIALDSKALGDTLAWFPYVDEFRKKHQCKMVCSTFWNDLFINNYPEIEFVAPGIEVKDIVAMYVVGWWDDDRKDKDLRPSNPRIKPLQQTCSDILGLPYREIRPIITVKNIKQKIKDPYVCIAMESTAGCKYWHRKNGWQDLVDYLNSVGYKVVNIQKEKNTLKNVIDMTGHEDIQNALGLLNGCEFFIGLASGLAWAAWALDKKVIMIAGFTEEYTEFHENHFRVINKNVCNGCWNDPTAYPFDKGDWNWCPRLKDTDRHFECTKQISVEDVIKIINTVK